MNDWEERYQEGDVQWDKGEPSPGLVDWLEERGDQPRGKVIVPGCGFGHDVRAWAKAGFDAVGYDVAPAAVKGGEKLLAIHYILPKNEEGPPFGTDRGEILTSFSPRFELLSDWTPRSYPNRTGLEQMFLWQRH